MTTVPSAHPVESTPNRDAEIIDVWSRATTKYRVRAALMLVLLGVLFGGLCCFTFWLRTGSYTPWEHPAFRDLFLRSFTGADGDPITLNDFLTNPIPVQEVPIHAVILGLQLASLCSIPILIAILYRLPSSVPFCAMIVFLAAMPWMGIAIQVGCLLACMGPFRFRFRYASALIALLPIGAYFIGASWRPQEELIGASRNQALLYAPWVLALLASCVISAFALAVARFINFRPGGIPPLLAVLFAIPVILFHANVGRHELEYRILEHEIGVGAHSIFAPRDIGKLVEESAVDEWKESGNLNFEELRAQILEKEKHNLRVQFESDRLSAIDRCNAFFDAFPDSNYLGNVQYLKACMQDIRIDENALLERQVAIFITIPPLRNSKRIWQSVATQASPSHMAATALYRLGYLEALTGDFKAAETHLSQLLRAYSSKGSSPNKAPNASGFISTVFERDVPTDSLRIEIGPFLIRAARLAEMIANCGDATSTTADPTATTMPVTPHPATTDSLIALLQSDPHHPRYADNLSLIIDEAPLSPVADYARVLRANSEPAVPTRIRQLRQIVEDEKTNPAEPMAMFFLADLLESERKLTESLTLFGDLIDRHPNSCWALEARPRISSLRALIDVRD